MKKGLTVRWVRWRRVTCGRLTSQQPLSAYEMATAEARCRRGIGRIIGHPAAEEVELLYSGWGEQTRFHLLIRSGALSADRVLRLRSLEGLSVIEAT